MAWQHSHHQTVNTFLSTLPALSGKAWNLVNFKNLLHGLAAIIRLSTLSFQHYLHFQGKPEILWTSKIYFMAWQHIIRLSTLSFQHYLPFRESLKSCELQKFTSWPGSILYHQTVNTFLSTLPALSGKAWNLVNFKNLLHGLAAFSIIRLSTLSFQHYLLFQGKPEILWTSKIYFMAWQHSLSSDCQHFPFNITTFRESLKSCELQKFTSWPGSILYHQTVNTFLSTLPALSGKAWNLVNFKNLLHGLAAFSIISQHFPFNINYTGSVNIPPTFTYNKSFNQPYFLNIRHY